MEDIFESIFGGFKGFGGFGSNRNSNRPRKGEDTEVYLDLDFFSPEMV